MENYRNRIYGKYVTMFKKTHSTFNLAVANRWGLAFEHYFRNWLPCNKNIAILDVACGDGKLLHFFITRGYTCVQGIDISHEQVSIARQVCPDVHEGDILDFLALHPESFDLITGIDIIEHLHKAEVLTFIDSCHSALKSKGRLILQTPNSDSPMSNSIHHGDFTHEVQLNSNSLSNLLYLCGFNTIEAREQGPVSWGCGYKSSMRFLAWQFIRIVLKLWNLVETGGSGSGIFTRVFLISGVKP